jgi:cob(I)alamin adenosyltransferase
MNKLSKGFIQIYTGNGKGKTTAAMGLAVRAAGSGIPSIIIQFLKGKHSSERESLVRLNDFIKVENYGSEKFITSDIDLVEHKAIARRGFSRVNEIISSGFNGVLILDEIITAVNFKLIGEDELIELMCNKPESMELVLTGRDVSQNIIAKADLVTEMKCVKHYFDAGIKARKGIED